MSTRPVAHQVVPGAAGAESATAEDGAVRPRDSLFHWCGTVDALGQANARADKQALLDAYFASVAEETAEPAASFILGTVLSRRSDEFVPVDREVVIQAIEDLAPISRAEIRERCDATGDLGFVAGELFAGRLPSGISVCDVSEWASDLVTASADAKRGLVRDMLARLSSLEAQYLVTLIVGELRLGIDGGMVDEALARRRASRKINGVRLR